MKSVIYLITILVFFCALFLKFDKLQNTDAELLQLDSLFSPLKKILDKKSTVSLKALSYPNEFYYRAQFILAPVVLDTFSKYDTVLLCRNRLVTSDTVKLLGYDTLQTTGNNVMTAVLLVKSKKR